MLKVDRHQKPVILEKIAEALDISESHYKKAIARYKSVGQWLEREKSILSQYKPQISPQGSIALGTLTKPVNDKDEYDLDAVCMVHLSRGDITQQGLKSKVGVELKKYTEANQMKSDPKEKRRCWRLEYANDAQFHMDILPAIPGEEDIRKSMMDLGVAEEWAELGIYITDNEYKHYSIRSYQWPHSNPKGYELWFKSRMRQQFEERRLTLAKGLNKAVDAVPEYIIKTPLQRAIQLLKRHRDIMFLDDAENKPISMIITTLAARTYNNESDLLETLLNIIGGMADHIELKNGIYWIQNPVDPRENFADKWPKKPKRQNNFFRWLDRLKSDFAKIVEVTNPDDLEALLIPLLGQKPVHQVRLNYPEFLQNGSHSNRKEYPHIITPAKSGPMPWGHHE